ncbi:MAG: WD40 repeat domain-containing protein [Candidatus Sabulitectum sp.]|nr:WD40 repeat domain-containing protein [Candidatus Sabulitectum sp.]
MSAIALILLTVSAILPMWELHLEATPRGEAQLISRGNSEQVLFIPLGAAGLGAWSTGGVRLPGFPASSGVGVIWRPCAVPASTGETLIAYADNDGFTHLVDFHGNEVFGWPVNNDCNVITSLTAVDLNDDGEFEIAYGTSNGMVQLLSLRGENVSGYPVDLQSQLQHQPTLISLGGGFNDGLICATNNSKITILGWDGLHLPGWPKLTGYPTGTIPVSGDINGDGQSDIVFASQDGQVHLYSLLGEEQEGWPFYMDARPVSGATAIGLLDFELQLPQIAVASIDSTVYLLNGDGSLAGTWRWPNRTDSRPNQPIISNTEHGPSVIATSNSGSIYAWDSSGRRISGYPLKNPGGIAFTPVAGDMNQDGTTELIVIASGGCVSAYPLATHVSTKYTWPLPLGNQHNSGSYGTDFLPVADVEQITGEFSGSFSISYSVSCSEWTGISVSYSTDAGYSWKETRNFIERPGAITWNSDQDLPFEDQRRCLVRITPYSNFGPGESGTSGLLHIDNNRPPEILMESPVKIDDSRYQLGYAVEDREGDIIQLQAQYSTDHGSTWKTMHLSGNSIEIEPWFYGEPVVWNAVRDIGHVDTDSIKVRIRAADSDPGPWYFIDGLHIDTDRLPSAQIIAPTTEVQGRVILGVRLSDPERDMLDVAYQFSTDGGYNWRPATVIEAEQAGIGRYDFEITWESSKDLPGFDGYQVRFQALPSDLNTGIAVPSTPFHLDNNSQPVVTITSPSVYDVFRGTVPVNFSLTDIESDDITLNLEYRLHGVEETWHIADGLVSRGPFGLSRYNTMLNWNSSVDLPEVSRLDVDIRLVATDGDSVRSEKIGPITLDNTNIPEVVRATIANMDMQRGQADIAFELGDRDSRTLDLAIDYSSNHGESWRQATISGNALGLNPHSYSNTFTWHYGTDIMGARGTVILRITPIYQSSNKLGRPRFIEQVFR